MPIETTSAAGSAPGTAHDAACQIAEAGGIVAAVDAARRRWAAEEAFTPATLDKCGDAVARFARRLHRQGVTTPPRSPPRTARASSTQPRSRASRRS